MLSAVTRVNQEHNRAADGVLHVAAVAIVSEGKLLVVSKKVAKRVFYLPGGKPDPGEQPADAVAREIREELAVSLGQLRPFAVVDDIAALEQIPMRMTVFTAQLIGAPTLNAELAAIAWTTGRDVLRPLLAPAVRNQVIPSLITAGLLCA
jgi:ADP-ribose pyrophosphatase YjhB (NUDIX family)